MSEIKDIPKHWEVRKLGDVCEKLSLNKIKIKQKDYLQQGKFPIIDQGQELIGGFYNDEKFLVPNDPPYIIFGDHTKVKKFIPFKFIAGADGVKVLKSKSNTDPKFLYYVIQTIKIEDKGYARHFQLLEKSDFPLPPLPEQQAIVAKIEELLSELENGKQQLQTAQRQLKVYRQSLLKWAFEGRLTNKDVKDGELPKGWKWALIGDICDMKAGFFVKADNIEKECKDGLFPCYGGNGLRGYTNSFTHKGKYSLVGRQGALCGNVHRVNGVFHATEHAVVTSPKVGLNTNWLFYKLTAMKLNQYSAGAAQPGLSVNKLLKIVVCYPPLAEQQLIVDELESKLTVCDKIEETISQSLQQAETLRQSILKKAFEGKLLNNKIEKVN